MGAGRCCHSSLCGPGSPSSPPHAGHFKGAEGRGQPGQAGLGLPLPKPPPEVEKHLENRLMELGFGIWRLGEPSVRGLSQAALFHFLSLKPGPTMAQFFKSKPFKLIIIVIITPSLV